MTTLVLRTRDVCAAFNLPTTTLNRALDNLGMPNGLGRGMDRLYDFDDVLVLGTYAELSQQVNSQVAVNVAADLRIKLLDGQTIAPGTVCMINSSGFVWVGPEAASAEYQQRVKEHEPTVIFYRVPIQRVQELFGVIGGNR